MAVRCHWFDFVLKIFWPGFALIICWSAWHLFHFLFYWFNTMPEIILIDIVSSALYQFVDGQVLFVKVNITIYSYLEIRKSFQVFFMSLRDMVLLFDDIFAFNKPMCLFTNWHNGGVFCVFRPPVLILSHNCYAVILLTSYFTLNGQVDALFIFFFNMQVYFW